MNHMQRRKLILLTGILISFVALMLFVGIPLPGTGAWTGTLAASFLDVGFKKSSIAVMCGVLIAGLIMGAAGLAVSMGVHGIFDWLAPH